MNANSKVNVHHRRMTFAAVVASQLICAPQDGQL